MVKRGRPRKMKGKGCRKIVVYHKVKGRVVKAKGYLKKSCLTKK